MSVDDWQHLTPSEVVPGRPFTDPAYLREDLRPMLVMAAALRRLLNDPLPEGPRPTLLWIPQTDRRQHRVAVANEGPLRAARDLAFVGFFGKKRPGIDATPLTAADDEMIQDFPAHPGILSYSSLELADGNWANLILTDPPEAQDEWRDSEKHAYAVRELAPRHYTVVRLYTGVFPQGLRSGRDPVLLRAKYYDFQRAEPWRAERALQP